MDNEKFNEKFMEGLEKLAEECGMTDVLEKAKKRAAEECGKEENKSEDDVELKDVLSKECSVEVHIKQSDDFENSAASVEFSGVKSLGDALLLGIAVLRGIVEDIDDEMEKIKLLAHMCAVVTSNRGIHKVLSMDKEGKVNLG